MSRNRSSTTCGCGLWSFQTERTLPIDDPGLLTQDQYFDAIELPKDHRWRSGPPYGYGYQDRLHGPYYMYHPPGNERAGASWRHDVYTEARMISDRDPVPESDRYRFRRLQCVFCRRLYVGWYCRNPHNKMGEDPPVYELYDTSFFYAFNDEPDDEDLRELREWTPEKLAALAKRWNEKEK